MANGLKYSIAMILSAARTAIAAGRRYMEDLTMFGLDEEYFEKFQAEYDEAAAFPTHEENQILLRNTTDSVGDVLVECYQWGQNLSLRLRDAFGLWSREHDAFPSEAFYNARNSENNMMQVMKEMIVLAKTYKEKLREHGQTDETIEEAEALLEALESTDNVQEVRKVDNHADTEERHVIFSDLVDYVNRTNRTGRNIARQKNDPVMFSYFRSPWPRYRRKAKTSGEEAA